MCRLSLVALLSLGLAVGLVAKEPVAELEAIAVNVMTKAFQVSDYDTVEALFGKLSIENKKKFLQEAVAMTMMMSEMSDANMPRTLLDTAFFSLMMNEPAKQHETLERWAIQKNKQTQLLGRLTLSLFEPSAGEKPQVPPPAPLGALLFAVPGHSGGFIALHPCDQAHIKELHDHGMIDAVTFHRSRIEGGPRVAARGVFHTTTEKKAEGEKHWLNDTSNPLQDEWEQFWSVPHHSLRIHYPNHMRYPNTIGW